MLYVIHIMQSKLLKSIDIILKKEIKDEKTRSNISKDVKKVLEKNIVKSSVFKVSVKNMMGRWYDMTMTSENTIMDVKKEIIKQGCATDDPDKIMLKVKIYDKPKIGDMKYPDGSVGRNVDDETSFNDLNTSPEGTIFFEMVIRLLKK